MKSKKILIALTLIPLLLIASTGFVSAGLSWKNLAMIESIARSSESYDIVWDGPSQGGPLFIHLRKDKPSSIPEIDASSVDYFSYERNNVADFSTSRGSVPRQYGSGGYGYGYRSYGSGYNVRNHYADNSERLVIENSLNNQGRHEVQKTGIIVAGNVLNTNTLARASVENNRINAERDVNIKEISSDGDVEGSRIQAERDVNIVETLTERDTRLAEIHYESHPRWDSNLGHYNWRY